MIKNKYNGDASNIWKDKPSSATVVYRFLEFNGMGIKIATMAANILARQFKIEFSDYYSIDISPDVHVKRVLKRLGYLNENPTIDQIIYKAREINPEFPGLIDYSCWVIGRNYCHETNPNCDKCPLNSECKKQNGINSISNENILLLFMYSQESLSNFMLVSFHCWRCLPGVG